MVGASIPVWNGCGSLHCREFLGEAPRSFPVGEGVVIELDFQGAKLLGGWR